MTFATSRPRGYRSSGILVVVATWIWVGATYGQSSSQLQVPVQVLQNAPVSTYQPMMALSGYYSDRTQVDPLSHYQRTRLGRWKIAKDVDRDDKAFGIQLETPVRTIRVRCETTINGKPFRVAREKTIDEYLAMAQNAVADAISETAEEKGAEVQQEAPVVNDSAATKEVKAEEADAEEADAEEESQTKPKKTVVPPAPYVTSSNKIRLAKYARSRGDLLTRHELRRRLADISGGPALLRTADNFGTQRHETMTLFAFLDTDGDGAISQAESGIAVKALAGRDLNSDKNVDLNELQLGLNSKSASRKVNSTKVSWQSWDATESEGSEDLSLEVAFSDDAAKSNLTIGDTQLDESWDLNEVDLQNVDRSKPNSSSAVSYTHLTLPTTPYV